MLTIRLARTGRKKHPHYRLVISEKARDTKGRSLEILGHYHPLDKDDKNKLILNSERIKHWISHGAQMSNTVKNLLIDAKVVDGEKTRTIGTYQKKKGDKEKEGKKAETKPKEKAEEIKTTEEAKEDSPEKSSDRTENSSGKKPATAEKKDKPKEAKETKAA